MLAERGEQLGRLGHGKRQIVLAEFGEPASAPPPADGQARVDPACQQHPRAPGKAIHDEAEALGDLRAAELVHVLQHDDQRIDDGPPRGQQPVQELRRQTMHMSCRRRLGEGAWYRRSHFQAWSLLQGIAGRGELPTPLRVGLGVVRAGFHAAGQGPGEHEPGGGLKGAAEQAGGAGRLET
jgi:hypothetical protein